MGNDMVAARRTFEDQLSTDPNVLIGLSCH